MRKSRAARPPLYWAPTVPRIVDERTPDLGLLDEERCLAIRAALLRLSRRDRWVVRARFFSGFTYDEIGDQLGVCRARVGQLVARALRRLRTFIDE